MSLSSNLLGLEIVNRYSQKIFNSIFKEVGKLIINEGITTELVVSVSEDNVVTASPYNANYDTAVSKGAKLVMIASHCKSYKIHKGITCGYLDVRLSVIKGITKNEIGKFALATVCPLLPHDHVQCDNTGKLSTNSLDASIKYSNDRMIEAALCLAKPHKIREGKYLEKLAYYYIELSGLYVLEYTYGKLSKSFGRMSDMPTEMGTKSSGDIDYIPDIL